jgi:hypothetical protein
MTNNNKIRQRTLAEVAGISRRHIFAPYIERFAASVTHGLKNQLPKAVQTNLLCTVIGAVTLLVALPGAGQDTNIQATAGVINPPFGIREGSVSQPISTGVTNGGRAVYTFTVTNAGDYLITASVNAPTSEANSFFVSIDATPANPTMVWDIPVTHGFEQRTVSWRGDGTPDQDEIVPKRFPLSAGSHELIIVGREADVQLQEIHICTSNSTKPSPPTNVRIAAVAN